MIPDWSFVDKPLRLIDTIIGYPIVKKKLKKNRVKPETKNLSLF